MSLTPRRISRPLNAHNGIFCRLSFLPEATANPVQPAVGTGASCSWHPTRPGRTFVPIWKELLFGTPLASLGTISNGRRGAMMVVDVTAHAGPVIWVATVVLVVCALSIAGSALSWGERIHRFVVRCMSSVVHRLLYGRKHLTRLQHFRPSRLRRQPGTHLHYSPPVWR